MFPLSRVGIRALRSINNEHVQCQFKPVIIGLPDSAELCNMFCVYVCAHLEHYAKYVHSSLVSPGAPGSHHDVNSLTGPTALLAFPPSICSSFFLYLPVAFPHFLPITLCRLLSHSSLCDFGQMAVTARIPPV